MSPALFQLTSPWRTAGPCLGPFRPWPSPWGSLEGSRSLYRSLPELAKPPLQTHAWFLMSVCLPTFQSCYAFSLRDEKAFQNLVFSPLKMLICWMQITSLSSVTTKLSKSRCLEPKHFCSQHHLQTHCSPVLTSSRRDNCVTADS